MAFYYFGNPPLSENEHHGYAPAIISWVLSSFYALTYAVAACFGAWESGRLRRDGVWQLAPARSRIRVAADVLLPVLLLAWAMLVFPTLVALVEAGVAPTVESLWLLGMAMVVCVAHVVIGFCVGLVLPRFVAAPALAMGVFFMVASSWSSGHTFWPRHVSGQFPVELMYGELPTFSSLMPHVLFVGGIALGACLCALLRNVAARILLAVALAVAGTVTSYSVVDSWGPNPELSTGNVPMVCRGEAPEVCVPNPLSADLSVMRGEMLSVLDALSKAEVDAARPRAIKDSLVHGRFSRSSTEDTWWLRITTTHGENLRYVVMREAIALPCEKPSARAVQRMTLWASTVTGTEKVALRRQREEAFTETHERELELSRKVVAGVRALPGEKQVAWYESTAEKGCAGTSTAGGS